MGFGVGNDTEMTPRKPIVSVGYAYSSDKLDGRHGGNNDGNIPVNNGNLNVNLNANYLDGYDAQALMAPVKRVIQDTMWVGYLPGNPRTKEFSPPIDPNKSVVLLGQPDLYHCITFQLRQVISSSVTIYRVTSTSLTVLVDYQIIE